MENLTVYLSDVTDYLHSLLTFTGAWGGARSSKQVVVSNLCFVTLPSSVITRLETDGNPLFYFAALGRPCSGERWGFVASTAKAERTLLSTLFDRAKAQN